MKRGLSLALMGAGLSIGLVYGFAVGYYRVFPFDLIQSGRESVIGRPEAGIKPATAIFAEFSPDVEAVMIGDSITEAGLWNEFFPGHKIANRGVKGDTTADILARFETIKSTRPDVSFVMAGINDIYRGVPPEDIAGNLAALTERLIDIGSGVVLHATLECSQEVCGDHLNRVRDLNKILEDLARTHQIKFLDLNQSLSGATGLRPEYTYDGTHLNAKGYRVWVELVRSEGLLE